MAAYPTTRRAFIASLGMGAAALALHGCLGAAQRKPASDKRPNVLFLFTDDQRFDALGCAGNLEVQTPNMDMIAAKGVSFTHAHIMGSQCPAVCMPSRAMLMSGRDLFHIDGNGDNIPAEHVTMPEAFRKDGYATFGTGKWHNGKASYARSFTHGGNIFFGGMSDHLQVPVHDFDPSGEYSDEKRHVAKQFSSCLFSDTAIDFLEKHDGTKPFFAYVSYTAPHDPRMAPKDYADLYPPDSISLPKSFLPEHPFDNGEMRIRDEMLAPFPRTPECVKEHIAAYYAMITHLDAQIGRVLKALEDNGYADNTIVILAGDNGLAVGRHGLMGKQNMYEHSVRVPLLFSGPGVPAGKTCDSLCYLHDVMPTVCGLAGVPVPASVQTRDLAPLMRGREGASCDSIFSVYGNVQRMVKTERWKLIAYNVKGTQTFQLFDLGNDPDELNNLAKKPEHAKRVAEMMDLLRERMRAAGDNRDIDKPDWGC